MNENETYIFGADSGTAPIEAIEAIVAIEAIEGCMRGIIYSGVAVDSMALLL